MRRKLPEVGERLKTLGAGVAVGIAGGMAETANDIYNDGEGLTGDEKEDRLEDAQDNLEVYKQVNSDARNSSNPNAPATKEFTGQKIKQAKQEIVEISQADTIDSLGDHADAFAGWGAIGGFVVGTIAARMQIRRQRKK